MLAGTVAWPAETAARYRREGYWDGTDLFDIVRRGAARWPGQIALIDRERRTTRMIMQVHDELVFEVPDRELDWARETLPRTMAGVATLAVPLVAEVGVGANWDEAH